MAQTPRAGLSVNWSEDGRWLGQGTEEIILDSAIDSLVHLGRFSLTLSGFWWEGGTWHTEAAGFDFRRNTDTISRHNIKTVCSMYDYSLRIIAIVCPSQMQSNHSHITVCVMW
jgi:hypothetical protein